MDNSKKLYDRLSADKLYTKSYDEFVGQFGNAEGQKKLYNALREQEVYTKSEQEFSDQFWGGVKKKGQTQSTVSVGPSKTTKPLSASTGQLASGPSASFGQLGSKFLTQEQEPLPSTKGELLRAPEKPKPYNLKDKAWLENNPVLQNSKQQIDEWENIKKKFEAGTYSAIGALDYAFGGPLAADWAEHIVYSAAGVNEEYNKLPPEAKKIIKEGVRGGTPIGKAALGMESMSDFWFKESEKVLNTAIKREGDSLTDMANFVENPSTETAKNFIYRGLESTAQTIPYMIATAVTGGTGGLVLAGGMAAGEEAYREEKETGNRGVGYLLSNAYTGLAEGYFEKYTQGLLKKAGGLVKGNAKAAESLAKGFISSIVEDFGVEGISEGLTTLTQELASKLALGEEIDGWDIARKVADATILGEFAGTGISVTGQVAGRGVKKSKEVVNNYLATKLLTAEQEKTLSNNTNTINELRTQVSSPDTSPAVRAIANRKIGELETQNKGIKDEVYTAAENLNVKGSVLLVGLDKALRSNRKDAEDIINDTSIDDPTKQLLLQDLLDEHNELKQNKDALQKQTTGQVPIQPEAGTGREMAKGITQAEPQVPTQEVKVEIEQRRQNDIKRYNERDQKSLESIMPNNPNHPIVKVGMKFNQGMKVIPVSTKASENFDNKEGSYEVITKIIEPAEVDSNGKMTKAAKVEITLFNNKAEADAVIKANFEKIQSQTGKKQQEINAKYDAELAALETQAQPVAQEIVYETNPETKEQWIGDFEIIDNRGGKADLEINGREGNWYVSNKVTGRILTAKSKSDAQNIIDNADAYDFGQGETFTKEITNEDLQTKESRSKNEEQAAKKGPQSEQERAQQSARNVSKRGEIKSSLERIKDAGVLKSAITGKDGITQKEIDAQMALTDAMADVWRETTGNDNFYETFFDDIKEGDTETLKQLGGLLFQNIEMPERPLTSVSLAVFNLPEFRKMEGQVVAINSIKDLARTRGKQIEKDLMQSVLEYDKYKDQKKISYDEFKSDVEIQVMKLEKINTSSYATYGMDSLGDNNDYGQANTIIYNSPVDHGKYGHFSGDFKSFYISKSIKAGTFDSTQWVVKQIPGTEQYVAIDQSMPENTSQDQISNYIGTAGKKEDVERWVSERYSWPPRDVEESNVNVGLFGHTRVWFDGEKYYLAELQSDYFQKNGPDEFYASQISDDEMNLRALDKYVDDDIIKETEYLINELKLDFEYRKSAVDDRYQWIDVYLKDKDGKRTTRKPLSSNIVPFNNEYKSKTEKEWAILLAIEVLTARAPIPEDARDDFYANAYHQEVSRIANQLYDRYTAYKANLLIKYKQDAVSEELEKIKNSDDAASMNKQFVASQKIHELRLMRESFRNAAQEGAETLLFPTPYTLAVIEGYVNKAGETGAPYEIISGDPSGLVMGDIIDYGGTEMTVVDTERWGTSFRAVPSDEVGIYNYYDYVDGEVESNLGDTIYYLEKGFTDINNISDSDINDFDFDDLPWTSNKVENILRGAVVNSDSGVISLSSVEDIISDAIRDVLYNTDTSELFFGDDVFVDGDTYYVVQNRNQIESLNQPDQYESETSEDDFESELSGPQKTVVNKYKELNKEFKKLRPDAEVFTDDNGMQWLETKLTPEDAVNPVIAFQEEGGKVKGAVDFSNDNKASFYMFNGADISSLSHEISGHLGRRFLEQLAKVDEGFSKDYNKACKWAGVKDNQWNIAAEEKFARAFERYLREGKAPTKALTSVFENFKTWLSNIYKKIKGSSIDVKLTPEIREVFDNMLGAKLEPKTTQAPAKEVSVKETAFTKMDKGAEAEATFDEIYKKRFEKTKDKLKAFASAKVALLKTDAYAAATRQQRLDMLSYLRNKYKLKMDTNLEATRAQIEVSKQVTADEIVSTIKDYLSRAIQEGVNRGAKRTKEALQAKRKADKKVLADTIEKIKKMIDKSSLKGPQAKAILNGLKLNLSNDKTMARYMERIDKIIKNVKYAEKLNEANDLKRKIKGLITARNIAAQNQLAKDFLTLSPDLSRNIDKYIEVANSVFNAITRGQRTPAIIADVEAYVSKAQAYEKELIQNTLDDIAEKAKAKLLKDNQNLVDAGVLSKDMTIDDINEYLYSINSLGDENVGEVKDKKKVLLEQAKEVFDALAPIAEMMISEGIDPFTGEEIEIDKSTKDLINRLLDVDLDKLDGADAYRLANSLQEFLVNGVVDDLEARVNAYESVKEAERLEKKGVKSTISTSQFTPLAFISKLWDINIKPLKSLLAKAFNGRIAGTEIFNSSGLRGISLGAARAKRIASVIISKYDKMYKDRRPNKKAFDDAYNTYERGVFAFLSRNINKATPEQKKAEFNRRMKLIGETIGNLRDTNKRDLIAMADVIQSIYDKIKDEGSIEGVAKFIDPVNQEAVNYWIEEFKNYYPEVKSVARTTYNTILEDDVDYTPDTIFKIIADETKYNPSGIYKMTSSLVKTKRSGSLLENKRTPSIRDEKDPTSNNLGVSFDFDLNMANVFQKTLVDVKTAPSVMYFKNFVNSAAFNRMVPDAEVRKTLKDRMGHYADSIREKDGSNYEDIVKEADAIARRISRYSTQRALGSISNLAKQTIPIFINTFVNLNGSGDISIFRAGLRSMSDPDIQKAIDESGYPISNRGLESQTSLDSADKLLKKANLNDRKSIFDTIDELGQKRLESFLKKPDVYAARASWVSYYLQDQKRKGVDINRIDWSQPLDSESANYAEDMVDLQQNTSESSSMGKLFSSKSPGTSLVRQFLFGYASFVMNQKDKVFTDVGILFSNSNKQEKEMAAKSLISTVAEMAAFEFVSMALSEGIMFIASTLIGGDDEDKETMQDRFNRMFKRAYTNTTASLLSPAPLLDKVVIYLLNQGITGVGNLLPNKEEVKKKGDKKKDDKFFYEDKGYAASPVTSALSYIGGAPGVSIRAGMSVFNNVQRIFSSQYQDVFGNDVQFSDKDKMMIAGALAFQIIAAGNLLPSEAERIANSVVIEVEKGARKSKKKKWSPM